MTTLGDAVAAVSVRLGAAGIEGALGDARLLAAHALGVDRVRMHVERDRRLTAAETAALDDLAARRAEGEPVSRIVGTREFWSLPFALTSMTLDPRPDSETVVEAALSRLPDRNRPLAILDLGTGTGCLLVALLTELPNAWGLGLDVSHGAAAAARRNADRLGVGGRAVFAAGDWTAALDGRFDLVVCNPPYIPDAEIESLAPEVSRFDPRIALSGGADGLDAYRVLAGALPGLLAPGGWAVLEVGAGQASAVAADLMAAGLGHVATVTDLGRVERCVCCKK